MTTYTEQFTTVAEEVGLCPTELHAATASLLCMDVETPGFRNMIRDIGKEAFAATQTIGDVKRVVLGYLVAH